MKLAEGALVQFENVEKVYGRSRALLVESLTLNKGERVTLFGANGSGKSTLLKLMAGITNIDSGRIAYPGNHHWTRIAYVPQAGGVYPDLSVRDNLDMRRRLFGLKPVPPSESSVVEALSLGDVIEKRISELSGGYQRLATLAAALQTEPDWLLLDEPFAGVDAEKRAALENLLEGDVTRNLSLLVECSPDEGDSRFCTRKIQLADGKLVQ